MYIERGHIPSSLCFILVFVAETDDSMTAMKISDSGTLFTLILSYFNDDDNGDDDHHHYN